MEFKLATRNQVKIKVGIQGPAGAGKTIGALLIAYGLCGDWSKIGVIDSENESASLYVDRKLQNGTTIGQFRTLTLKPPYSPERYSESIKAAEESPEIEVIVVDSISHEWMGKGGILDIHEQMGKMNDMQKWAKLTPRHNRFIDDILQCRKHMVLCMRSKQDYIMKEGTSSSGRATVIPEKVGLKAVTKDGVDYEFTLNFDIDINNFATATKDRTAIFKGNPEFKITKDTGEIIKKWCETGVDINVIRAQEEKAAQEEQKRSIDEAETKLKAADSIDQLAEAYKSFTPELQRATVVIKDELKAKLTPKAQQPAAEVITPISETPSPAALSNGVELTVEQAIQKLNECQNLPQLKTTFMSFTIPIQKATSELKEQLKTKLGYKAPAKQASKA